MINMLNSTKSKYKSYSKANESQSKPTQMTHEAEELHLVETQRSNDASLLPIGHNDSELNFNPLIFEQFI